MLKIRPLEGRDNKELATLIRNVFLEFGIARPGTVYSDPTTDDLYHLFRKEGSIYWVAEDDGIIRGGCGIYPTDGLPEGCTELVKFYLAAESRGKGIGRMLMERSIESARQAGYRHLYLESLPELGRAITLYERTGFSKISHPLGNSGHFGCDIWMVMNL